MGGRGLGDEYLLKLNPHAGVAVLELKGRVEVTQQLGGTSSELGGLPLAVLHHRVPRGRNRFAHSHLIVLVSEIFEGHPKRAIICGHEVDSLLEGRGPQSRVIGPITSPLEAKVGRRRDLLENE